jgi:uncharacterized membrane protein HdeD (DUF308 family)
MSLMTTPVAGGIGSAGRRRRLPRWLQLGLAIACLLLGVVIVSRPTTSLGLMALLLGAGLLLAGVQALAGAVGSPDRAALVARAAAVLWLTAGVFVLVLPGLTVRLVGLVVGVLLIVNGVLRILECARAGASLDERISAAALGAAGVIFGVLALLWPDITLLVVAIGFGAQLIIQGLVQGWAALRARTTATDARPPGAFRRWAGTAAAVAAVVLALVAAGLSASLNRASPVVDDFYAAPRAVPPEPGRLVRAEAFGTGVPEGARGWRILYTTTRGDGTPALASGLVVVPIGGQGAWPVIAWTHGTTGFAENCAPSLLAKPFEAGALFVLPQILAQGWALVATDYIGLGTIGPHPYLIGPDSAHAELDAVRAARQLTDARLGQKTVAWGHSQGGGAALWTGAVATSYAPDVPLSGVAALAPASDLIGLIDNLPHVRGGSVFASYVLAAYTAIYPDVTWRDYVRPGAEQTVRSMSGRCLSEPGVLVSVLQALALSKDRRSWLRIRLLGPSATGFARMFRRQRSARPC